MEDPVVRTVYTMGARQMTRLRNWSGYTQAVRRQDYFDSGVVETTYYMELTDEQYTSIADQQASQPAPAAETERGGQAEGEG